MYTILTPDIAYILNNIWKTLKPFSVIERHCNIIEYNYTTHDDHPHLHKHDGLLHISFIDNNFYEDPVCKETYKKIMFIPLREGLREIREIVINSMNENNEELTQKIRKGCCISSN